ncbi:MAG: hypothetical protein K6E12_02680 [Saccharofermentans sp.]|nr:hypothetical protein [Saccharofermentans sp.]
MNKKKAILLIISVIMLILGLLLYLLLNRDAYVSKVLLEIIPIQINTGNSFVLTILRSFGADFLWSVSFTLVIQLIVWTEKKKTVFLVFCSLLGIVFELMQRFGIAPGTADIVDGIVYILGSLLAILIIRGGKLYEEKSGFSDHNGD